MEWQTNKNEHAVVAIFERVEKYYEPLTNASISQLLFVLLLRVLRRLYNKQQANISCISIQKPF